MPPNSRQKLYCYVDETGQDDASHIFVVVAVLSADNQDDLRRTLMEIEQAAGTGHRKWHKSRSVRRLRYLNLVLEKNLMAADIFFGTYPKPLPYFFPFVDVLERAIKAKAAASYTARIFVDGIDRQKSSELTNALRLRGIALQMVKGRRDESEPLIRLADMWAGCIRAALLGAREERELLNRAIDLHRLFQLDTNSQKENTP